jgi:methionyl-tRNA synthetase
MQRWGSASDLLLKAGHKIPKPKVLFRKVSEEELKPWIERFKGSRPSA